MTNEILRNDNSSFFDRFNSPAAQQLFKLHFAEQLSNGVYVTYDSLLLESIEDDFKSREEAYRLAEEVIRAEFPLLVVADTDSETNTIVDLNLIKVDPKTGKKQENSWISVVGQVEVDGTLSQVYSPWTQAQALLIQRQAKELTEIGLDPRELYYDVGQGWSK